MAKPITVNPQALSGNNPDNSKASNGTSAANTASKSSKGKLLSPSRGKWSPPVLKPGFDLEKAVERAYKIAEGYMNKVLSNDDMKMNITTENDKTVGNVSTTDTGKFVNSYSGMDILKLYSQNVKERGIIIDGRV